MGEPGQHSRSIGSASGADGVLFAEGPNASLPLRLSVGKAGLHIELAESVSLGPVVVRELALSLERLAFPIDLSKGVKQFLHRRTRATSLVLEVRIDELVKRVSEIEFPFVGAAPSFAVGRIADETETALAFSVRGERAVAAWDLVLSIGESPCFVVDRARSLGGKGNALANVLSFLDGLAERSAALFGEALFERRGRALHLDGVARASLLELSPLLGMRLPLTSSLRLNGVELASGKLSLEFSENSEILPIGRRGLRLAGLSEHLKSGDDLLAAGDVVGARSAYLRALEGAPGDRTTLLALGDIDRGYDDRVESALSYFSEVLESDAGMETAARAGIAEALLAAGRLELAKEQFVALGEREGDSGIAALAYYFAHEIEGDAKESLRLLSLGLSRAPAHGGLSFSRFRINLALGEFEAAAADAERYLAQIPSGAKLARARIVVGNVYAEHGHLERAERLLSLAHREEPDSPEVRLALGCVFEKRGMLERCIQMFVPLVKILGAPDAPEVLADEAKDEVLARVRLILARSYVEVLGDLGLAVNELRSVESRGKRGAEARAFEGELLARLGEREGRIKAHFRLLEAIELGWIDDDEGFDALLSVTEIEVRAGQREFGRRACALVRERVDSRHASERTRSLAAEFARLEALLHT